MNSQKGFTILELMIALSVLSVLLLASTTILTQIGSLYIKGVNSADLQNTARTVNADVVSSIQFGTATPSAPMTITNGTNGITSTSICIGSTRYTFVKDRALGEDGYDGNVLWRDATTGVCNSAIDISTASRPSSGSELVGKHMRITKFTVTETRVGTGLYSIKTWMAYGDNDNDGDAANDLVRTNKDSSSPNYERSTCSGDIGTEYCAVSELSTTTVKRLVQ